VTRPGFEAFYRAERASAVRLCALLCGSGPAEDLAQEAFLRVHQRFDTLDNAPAYLRVVILNLARSWLRSQGRLRRALPRLYEDIVVSEPGREVLDALAKLPYRQRATLVLRYWAALPERDIAAALGVRPGTVKSLASRALRRLEADLKDAE
jgi:RNA polymerase sigma factor (sigma-70 family)